MKHGLVALSAAQRAVKTMWIFWSFSHRGDEANAARIGETGEPWGTPVLTGVSSSVLPSRRIAVFRPVRNAFVHLMRLVGMFFSCMIFVKHVWEILSKKPVTSIVRADVTSL